jgi:lysophospholipase
MSVAEPLTTYLELRASTAEGDAGAGLSHSAAGLVLLHVQEIAPLGVPTGGLTLLHDAGDHGGRYLAAARILAEGGWAVALPDLRGHGRSEGERGHSAGLKEVLRDVQAVQDHVAYRLPDAPKVLFGQGLGALYAAAYAAENPGQLAALVLLAPLWSPRFELPQPASGLKRLFKKVGPSTPGRTGFDAERLTSDPAERAAWRQDELAHDVITLGAGTQAAQIARDYLPRLSELGLPVLVVHGTSDTLADPAPSRALRAPVETRILEGRMHDLLHDVGGAEVAREIRNWLRAVR